VALLPAGPRCGAYDGALRRLDETWLCWIGGHRPGEVFYYRIQSPVIIVELDHHCGVFLDYHTPPAIPHSHGDAPHRTAMMTAGPTCGPGIPT